MATMASLMALVQEQAKQQNALMQKMQFLMEQQKSQQAPQPAQPALRRSPRRRTPCGTPVDRLPDKLGTPECGSKLKKRLSFGSGKKRQLKTGDELKLRKDLGKHLHVLDSRLVNDAFQSKAKPSEFDTDLFSDALRPLLKSFLGDDFCEDVDDDDADGWQLTFDCYNLAVDIAKKRRYYLQNQAKATTSTATNKKAAKAKATTATVTKKVKKVKATATNKKAAKAKATKATVTNKKAAKAKATKATVTKATVAAKAKATKATVKKKVKAEPKILDMTKAEPKNEYMDESQVDKYFEPSSDEAEAGSYECWHCADPIESLQKCFPEEDRKKKGNLMFQCKECYTKLQNDALTLQLQDKITREEQKAAIDTKKVAVKKAMKRKVGANTAGKKNANTAGKKNANTAGKKKANNAGKKKANNAGNKFKFDLHANVLAKWDNNSYYPAQIYGRYRGNYNVYFPEDGATRKNVPACDIKCVALPVPDWAKCKRKQFIQMRFLHTRKAERTPAELVGKYIHITGLGKGKNINDFVCHCEDDDDNKEYTFDVGYVSNILLGDIFPLNPNKGAFFAPVNQMVVTGNK